MSAEPYIHIIAYPPLSNPFFVLGLPRVPNLGANLMAQYPTGTVLHSHAHYVSGTLEAVAAREKRLLSPENTYIGSIERICTVQALSRMLFIVARFRS